MIIKHQTFGCKVNQYDTQAILDIFASRGYDIYSGDGAADIYLINTCTVTHDGDRKSLKAIRRALRDEPSAVIVTGCLAQRDAQTLLDMGVSVVVGTQQRSSIPDLTEEFLRTGTPQSRVMAEIGGEYENLSVSSHIERTRAVMKIQDGCNSKCSYCIIPSVRGAARSRNLLDISKEAQRLADAGYKELVLTGIHLSSYGVDCSGNITLADAITAAHSAQNIARLRLGSLEPSAVTREFISGISRLEKVCPHFHLSLQSGSDSVLARMRRRYNTKQFRNAVSSLREAYPKCSITTDVIAGFPGETNYEHAQTLDFIQEMGFSKLHVFKFSPRAGTEAAGMPVQLSNEIKHERAQQLLEQSKKLSVEYISLFNKKRCEVLLESSISGAEHGADGLWAEGYTPEYIRVIARGTPGQIKNVICAAHGDYLKEII